MSAEIAPAFPKKGYVAFDLQQVMTQRKQQQQEVDEVRCEARQNGQPSPCVQVLNISLFFDGTNNHGKSDDKASPVCSSNVRRLFNASVGKEVASNKFGYYSYYIQGVGTAFKEIEETEPKSTGLTFAVGGEERILWGVTRIVDALTRAMSDQKEGVDAPAALQLIRDMQYSYEEVREHGDRTARRKTVTTVAERQAVMQKALAPIIAKREAGYKPHVLRIKLFVYGFSRGAAEARAFLWRLGELCDRRSASLCGIPLTVEFVGLFDTVASVGFTEHMPNAEGHMGWADGTMKLPPEPFLALKCAHMVSAHEQRLSFPLDSVALANRKHPGGVVGEWVYPGMHSDVGGGYPPGDQGKAREGQGMLLSQLPLLHMYRLAFDHGAPLQISKVSLQGADPEQLAMLEGNEPWRFMESAVRELFQVDQPLKDRFEAWRKQAGSGATLEELLQYQAAQITAWRIARYAGGQAAGSGGDEQAALKSSPFYQNCKDTPPWLATKQEEAWKQAGKARRKDGSEAGRVTLEPPQKDAEKGATAESYTPNIDKDYEATMDQTQVREAAEEFAAHYRGRISLPSWKGVFLSLFSSPSRLFSDDCNAEGNMLRKDGDALYAAVSGDPLLMALYDEHVHDSRAWFMHAVLGQREPHGSYFRYRTVFFTDGHTNKADMCKAPDSKVAVQAQNSGAKLLLSNSTQH